MTGIQLVARCTTPNDRRANDEAGFRFAIGPDASFAGCVALEGTGVELGRVAAAFAVP